MVHTELSSRIASRRARRTLVGGALLAAASCVPSRPTPPPTPVSSAPRPDTTRLAARPDSAPATPPRRNPFEGADLSPKPPVLPLSPSDEQRHFLLQPGYHMNKKNWNTVELFGGIPAPELRGMIDHSYDLVVARLPKRT